jgi:divalent metal cation (Fe/Co/Zn/Cd) transporter
MKSHVSALKEVKYWLLFGFVYNAFEALVSLWTAAQSSSIALLGFGIDSIIETAAAGLVLWQLQYSQRNNGHAQSDQIKRLLGVTFWALALYIAINAIATLKHCEAPDSSLWGVGITGLSLLFMPLLAWRKTQLGRQLHNPLIIAEAKETLVCGMLSLTTLLGLLCNQLWGWWWADPVAALLMTPWLIKEGWHCWQGHVCSH